jgi:transcription antitermination factor NusG
VEPAEGRARIRVSERVRVIAGLFTGREGVVADVRGVSRWRAEAQVCVRL